jgi:hypothetical protein
LTLTIVYDFAYVYRNHLSATDVTTWPLLTGISLSLTVAITPSISYVFITIRSVIAITAASANANTTFVTIAPIESTVTIFLFLAIPGLTSSVLRFMRHSTWYHSQCALLSRSYGRAL